jgi:phosphoribosylanthranilate isomerase
MKVKVCGITREEDLKALAELQVDFIGFILHPESKRYVGINLRSLAEFSKNLKLKRVGVFVNEQPETVAQISKEHKLDYVQLHGNESPDYCKTIRESVSVIKAFNIDESFDFSRLKIYNSACDYFLFDAKGKLPGGNNISYDWSIL